MTNKRIRMRIMIMKTKMIIIVNIMEEESWEMNLINAITINTHCNENKSDINNNNCWYIDILLLLLHTNHCQWSCWSCLIKLNK